MWTMATCLEERKKVIWDKDDKLDAMRMQTIAESRRMEVGASGDVVRKTRLIVYGIVVLSYSKSVIQAYARVY